MPGKLLWVGVGWAAMGASNADLRGSQLLVGVICLLVYFLMFCPRGKQAVVLLSLVPVLFATGWALGRLMVICC